MPPAPPTADDAAPTPVFVDDSGRRHRAVRVVGWCLAAVMLGYLALLGISLVGSPGLVPLTLPSLGRVLPGPAAPLITDPAHTPTRPGDLVSGTVAASPAPATTGGAPGQQPTTSSTTKPRATARALPTATPKPTATPTPSPTAARPTASPQATPNSTHRPTTHPSPHSTKRSAPLTSATPTATAS